MTDTVSYNPEDGNDKYQDIFSNSEVPDNTNRKVSKNLSKDKENFYNIILKNNYLIDGEILSKIA